MEGTAKSVLWRTRLPPTTLTPPAKAVHGVEGETSCVGGGLVSLTAFSSNTVAAPVTRAEMLSSRLKDGTATTFENAPDAAADTGCAGTACAISTTTTSPRHTLRNHSCRVFAVEIGWRCMRSS